MNEWQPFWKNLTGQIASLSQRYLPEQKVREEWLSRFLPSSNLAKKGSSKSSRQRPIQKSVLEPELVTDQVTVNPELKKPRKNRKKSVTATKAEKTRKLEQDIKTRLEAELRSKLEIELKTSLESEIKSNLETKLKPSLEVELKNRLETELRPELEAELKTDLECEIKSSLEAELKPRIEVELKSRIEAKIRSELETELKTSLEAELKPRLEVELKSRLEAELRPELETELKTSLEAELKPRIEVELKSRLEAELRPELETELKTKLEAELRLELDERTLPRLKAEPEIKTENESKLKNDIEFDMDTKQIVEAILFAADKPMTTKQVQKIYPELEMPELQKIQAAIDSIIEDYEPRAIGLKQLASGYSFQVKEGYSYWVSRVFEEKPPKYSRALLETVAIIAYRQPVTRGDIEDIRGVSVSSNIIRTLLDREWVRIIAHKEVPGRPALYGTTKQFLDYFNLSSLDQLPTLEEIKDMDFSSEKTLNSGAKQKTEQNHSQENSSTVTVNQVNKEQEIEKQTSETPQIIEPISETRH